MRRRKQKYGITAATTGVPGSGRSRSGPRKVSPLSGGAKRKHKLGPQPKAFTNNRKASFSNRKFNAAASSLRHREKKSKDFHGGAREFRKEGGVGSTFSQARANSYVKSKPLNRSPGKPRTSMSSGTKTGLGVAGAAVAGYGAYRGVKHIRQQRNQPTEIKRKGRVRKKGYARN